MKIGIFAKYSPNAGSSRQRLFQYVPYLREQGCEVETSAFFDESYLTHLYAGRARRLWAVPGQFRHRLHDMHRMTRRPFDVVWVQQELLPYLPFAFEGQIYSSGAVVGDFDDALFEQRGRRMFASTKTRSVMTNCRSVVVGSKYLAAYAQTCNTDVHHVPTTIDLDRYQSRKDHAFHGSSPVLGWIGTPVTAPHLRHWYDGFKLLHETFGARVVLIGATPEQTIPGVPTQVVPWRWEDESQWIRSFDIGVMPLERSPFALGKCAYKLIQYMGCAVPVIGEAFGSNCDLIADGVNGFVALECREFVAKASALLESRELRARIGNAGRRTVELGYSLQARAPEILQILEHAAGLEKPRPQEQCIAI